MAGNGKVSRNKAKALAKAQQYLQKNNIDRALRELLTVVQEDPKDLRTRQKVAELMARQGRNREAMKEFTLVAETYRHGGFFPKAVSIYKQMIRIEPDEMAHHLALGEVYQQLAHMSDAMDHFNIVAQHYEEKGTTKDRVKIYQKLSAIVPESLEYAEKLAAICLQDADPQAAFEVWKNLANRLAPKGPSDGLLRAYEGMHKFRSDDLELTRKLADLYLDRSQPKKALEKLQEAFKVDSQDTETLNLLADAFVDLGQKDKAVAILKELGRIYESVGFTDYKNQVLDRIAEIDPEGSSAAEAGSNLLQVIDDPLLDGLELDQLEALDEDSARAVIEVEVYRDYGLVERALSSAEKGIAQFSGCFPLQRHLVALCLEAGDQDRARSGLSSMYEIAMDRGNYRVARDSLARVVDLDPEDEVAIEKLQAFEDAMGEYLGPPELAVEEAELAEVEPEPLDADEEVFDISAEPLDDDDDFALADGVLEAIEEDSVGDEPSPSASLPVVMGAPTDMSIPVMNIDDDAFEELDNSLFEQLRSEFDQEDAAGSVDSSVEAPDASESGFSDFDFDDEELQRLAEQMSGGTDAGDEPVAAEELADAPEPEASAASAVPEEQGSGTGFDLSDLSDLDDLDDLEESVPSAYLLGKSYFESGAYQDAIVELQRAVDGGEELHSALELLGTAQRRTRDFKSAVKTFRRLLAENPEDGDMVLRVLFELAITYEVVGKSQAAQSLYRKLNQLSPGYRDGEVERRLQQLGG